MYLASSKAAFTYAGLPLAEIATKTSSLVIFSLTIFFASNFESSAFSTDLNKAEFPPAIIPWIIEGEVLKVGGHSTASKTPSLPLVPQPK